MTPLLFFILQSAQDVSGSLREFGVAVTMLIVMTATVFLIVYYALAKIIPSELERREKLYTLHLNQLREDHAEQIRSEREGNRDDRERDAALVQLQRTEFLASLDRHNKTVEAVVESLTRSFREASDRAERHYQQQTERICQRLDVLTVEVKALAEGRGEP